MEPHGTQMLVDEGGQPLEERIQRVLRQLLPKLRARFPQLADDQIATEVLEAAGRHIQTHERDEGVVRNLEAYAWVVVGNAAKSKLRRGSMRLVRSTLPAEDSETLFESMPSALSTAEQIESRVFVGELMAQLSPDERLLCVLKKMGFSSREIAQERGTTIAQVDTLFYRIKRKIRAVLRDESEAESRSRTPQPHKPRTT